MYPSWNPRSVKPCSYSPPIIFQSHRYMSFPPDSRFPSAGKLSAEVLAYRIALERLHLGFAYHISIADGVNACRLNRNVS